MKYELRRSYKANDLTPEEREVMSALKEYETVIDDDDIPLTEFVPVLALYNTYRRYWAKQRAKQTMMIVDPDEQTQVLGIRAFGAALSRVWPGIIDYRSRRTVHGLGRVHGYVGVRGPDSCEVKDQAGNPGKRSEL